MRQVACTAAILLGFLCPAFANCEPDSDISEAFHAVYLLEVNTYRCAVGAEWNTQLLLRREDGQCHEWFFKSDCHQIGDRLWWVSDHSGRAYIRAEREIYTRTERDPEVEERDLFPVRFRVPYIREVTPWP